MKLTPGDKFVITDAPGDEGHAFKVGQVVTYDMTDADGDHLFLDEHGFGQFVRLEHVDPENWAKFRVQGREEALTADSPRVVAIHEVARSLHHWGYIEEEALGRLLLIVNTSSRSEREYIAGVVQLAYEQEA